VCGDTNAQVFAQRAVLDDVPKRGIAQTPTVVLTCALGTAIVWLAVLFVLFDVGQESTIAAGTMGVATAIGAGSASLWNSWTNRSTDEYLAKTEHDARHDQLTGLYNRNALFTELEWSHRRAKEADTVLGVLFLDLDRFKVINDSMGHDAGDELLRIVATRIQSAVRGSDIVARFGGDEFVVVCRDLLSERSVLAVANQILKSFAQPVSLYGGAQVISTSIGVAIARPDDTRRPEDLVRDADAAMYKAKKSRSGFAVFDEAQRLQVIDRLDIERDLVKALDEEQLTVFYQPLVDVRNKRLYGFEALVRWNHPERGTLGPGQFLPVAEETGMMARIGELVLREACAQAAVWNHLSTEAHDIKMSVNIAEQQLLDANFPMLVAEVLAWSGLPPEQLVLEIIEDVIVDHLDGLSILRDIRALGVGLAIDDFGTGQSSLSYVKQFDMVSTLKIDKSFIDEMNSGTPNRAIIEAIVAMAKALGLAIVAEGVESNDQVRELTGLGVSLMQGYLFNKPVRADIIDPNVWFAPRGEITPARPGLTPLEVSRALAEPHQPRPARRG
jgi:diguanylate cyclase (GGDEF)-like protein